MQTHVTRQTAIALREAGFPQPPTVEHGQSWYSCHADPFYIDSSIHTTGVRPHKWFACYPAYAPTATDILKELGGPYGLRFYDESEKWCCTKEPSTIIETTEPFMHENPAEAVAAAWLAYNQNK